MFFILFFLLSLSSLSIANAQTPIQGQLRSFEEIFPGLTVAQKAEIFGSEGLIYSHKKNEGLAIFPAGSSGIDLHNAVMRGNYSFLAESLLVMPYQGKILNKLDAYNALGKIRGLKGLLYHSHTRNTEVPLFEEATRIDSVQKNNPIPDPERAIAIPTSEIVFLRLKDVNFGDTFYKATLSPSPFGITYNLTNEKPFKYLFFTIIKEERFLAVIYLEPLVEGMLIYSTTGADASDFIAGRIDIPSAITKRLEVFISWVSNGIEAAK